MNRLKHGVLASLLTAAVAFGACGGDDSTTTVTETTQTPSTSSSTTSTTESTIEATTTSIPDQEEPTAGEIADLPLCSEGPTPCRDDATGEVIEPGENSGGGGGVVAP